MLTHEQILAWLREKDPTKLSELWKWADRVRAEQVGAGVWFRGLIELSSYCRRNCLYCGIRAARTELVRYRLSKEEILDAARLAYEFGYGTVVLQGGEDPLLSEAFVSEIIQEIKDHYGLFVTLSLGERKESELAQWRKKGADRYLLRFETSNERLYRIVHPRSELPFLQDRFALLRILRDLGYEIGSGVMIGIPGQEISELARDIELFHEYNLDMIGCGPFLAHPKTPLGADLPLETLCRTVGIEPALEQVPATNEMAFKVIALARLLCPSANIPSTTAIATIDGKQGRVNGLCRGANVIMPNLTPMKYRQLYEIYPNKAASLETASETDRMAREHVRSIGRFPAEMK